MKTKGIIKSKYQRRMLCSAAVTLFIISLISAAFIMTAIVYKESIKVSYGEEIVIFDIYEKDKFIVLGKKIYFPVMTFFEKVFYIIRQYAPGIVKLPVGVFNTVRELLKLLISKI